MLFSLSKRILRNMRDIIVVGSRGYIGSFLARHLREAGHRVIGYDVAAAPDPHPDEHRCAAADIPTDALHACEAVVYLAGLSGRASCAAATEAGVNAANVEDIGVLAARLLPTKLLVFASTAGVAEGRLMCKEDDPIDVGRLDSYTRSMLQRELHLDSLIRDGRVTARCIGLRLGTVIGLSPRQRTDLLHVAMLRSALLRGRITVRNATMMRSVLWNRDLLRAIERILERGGADPSLLRVFNMASYNCTIAKVANELACKTGALLDYEEDDGSLFGFSMDTSRFEHAFGFRFRGTFDAVHADLISDPLRVCGGASAAAPSDDPCFTPACRVCKRGNLMTVLDMGRQPLANNFLPAAREQDTFPLCLVRCRDCHHTQLDHTIPPGRMFDRYLYTSGTSRTLREYFAWMAAECDEATPPRPDGQPRVVVELACNDGCQLDEFKRRGWRTVGVDPAANIAPVARAKGHDIHVGFWGCDEVDVPTPDVLMGQNVLAHVPDPIAFLHACVRCMGDHTTLVLQTSQCDMFRTGEFDTVYHEHLSYFTAHSFRHAAEAAGLVITDMRKTPVHGTSFLVRMRKRTAADDAAAGHDLALPGHHPSVATLLAEERELGITDDFFYVQYRARAENLARWFERHVFGLPAAGYALVAYGAAAKGMTLLNYMRPDTVAYIVDDAPMKQGTFSPQLNVPVRSTDALTAEEGNVAIIVFAWNFLDEIVSKVRAARSNARGDTLIITPFPQQAIYRLTPDGIETVLENRVRLPDRNGASRPRTILLSHFYNEEMLMPHWIRHHAPMFDEAVLVDYDCTDASRAIIEREAPSSWRVVSTRNTCFEARSVDAEIEDCERTLPLEAWKLTLNTTEFLLHPNLREHLRDQPPTHIIGWPVMVMVGKDPCDAASDEERKSLAFRHGVPLLKQRTEYLPDDFRPRYMHHGCQVLYAIGRHGIDAMSPAATIQETDYSGVVCKFTQTPWPECAQRKFQIQSRIPESDRVRRLGFHHLIPDHEALERGIMDHKAKPRCNLAAGDHNPYGIAYTNVYP